jgi:hypothetical protein
MINITEGAILSFDDANLINGLASSTNICQDNATKLLEVAAFLVYISSCFPL